jgi:hypothetical protein
MNNEKFIPNKENIKMFDVKFLIKNEDTIDWEKLSAIKERSFSIAEIKMFGKRIAWNIYIINHQLREEELKVASKYFNDKNFEVISFFNNLPEHFIREYAAKLDWLKILNRSKMSQDFILEMSNYWSNLDSELVAAAIVNNSSINLRSERYDKLALYLKLKE